MTDSDLQRIIQSKEVERRRLRELPWLEKLEMLDRLRDRHLLLQQTRPPNTGGTTNFRESGNTNGLDTDA